jgi:hypothetical protein
MRKKGHPGGGESNRLIRAIEELLSQVSFKAADLLTDARLRDVHALRGTREASLLRDGYEVGQLPQLHGAPPFDITDPSAEGSQRALAERMGTTQSVISRLEEGGGARNRLDALARVAKALDRHLVVSFPEKVPTPLSMARSRGKPTG